MIVLAAFSTPRTSSGEDKEQPIERLNGRWDVTKRVFDGTELPMPKVPNGFFIQIDGQLWRYSSIVSGKPVVAEFIVSLGTAKSPLAVDAMLRNGAKAGGVCKGLYELNGDILTLCLPDDPVRDRPQNLESTPGSGLHSLVLRRRKAPAQDK